MTFWWKSWNEYRKIFFKRNNFNKFFIRTCKLQFWQPHFFWNDKTVSAKSQAKVKVQVFLKQISSTESLRHVESSFDNLAPLPSQNILKVYNPNHKTLEKVYSFKKDFNSIKSSSRNAKCKFGNPAESLSREVRKKLRSASENKQKIIPLS